MTDPRNERAESDDWTDAACRQALTGEGATAASEDFLAPYRDGVVRRNIAERCGGVLEVKPADDKAEP